MARVKKTPNQIKYDKELKRIKNIIKREQKKGFVIRDDIVPQRPKRITSKTLENLKAITPKMIRQTAIQKPEITKGKKLSSYRKKKATKYLPKATDIVLNNFKDVIKKVDTKILDRVQEKIQNWSPDTTWSDYFSSVKDKDKNILTNILNGAINQYGIDTVAQRLNDNAVLVNNLVDEILYDSGGKGGRDKVQFNLQEMSAIVTGGRISKELSKVLTEQSEVMTEYE